MKNHLEQKLQDASQELQLTHHERDTMRAAVREFMRTNPLAVYGGATPSPYHYFFIERAMPFVAILLFILVSAGGTAFAAEGTLPGDVLYPVKISVNEQVQSALAFSPSAKAEVHASLAERRLEEAEALASVGKLDVKTTKQIKGNFNEHAAVAQTIAKDIAKTDPAEAAQLSTQLAASLSVNNIVLKNIGDDSDDEDTKQDSQELSLAVSSSMVELKDTIIATSSTSSSLRKSKGADDQDTGKLPGKSASSIVTASLAPSTTPNIASTSSSTPTPTPTPTTTIAGSSSKMHAEDSGSNINAKEATELGARATKNLDATRSQFDEMKDSINATTTASAEARFTDITALLKKGDAAIAAKLYSQAFADYSLSLTASARLQVILKAVKRVKPSMINSLFILKEDDSEVLGTTTNSVLTGSTASGTTVKSTPDKNGSSTPTTTPKIKIRDSKVASTTASSSVTSPKKDDTNMQSKKEPRSIFQKVIHLDLSD